MVNSSLVDLLDSAAGRWPDRPIRIVGGRDVTLPMLFDEARRAAGAARGRIQAGDRVLLLLEDIDDFLVAFWAVQFLGATAIPLAPPRPMPSDLERVRRVLAKTRGPVVTDRGVVAPLPTIDVASLRVDAAPADPIRGSVPALVQFSSGSTGDPRGVVLTHAQLLANVAQLSVLPWQEDDVLFVWMPHFHDMGLIGGHLLPLRVGMQQVRMSAANAMRNPMDWLQTAQAVGTTVLSSTNFGLTRVNARLAAGAAAPDLSRVRMVVNGAEPINPDVCRTFSRLTGIPESAHFPMYGLAEATVGVAAPRVPGLRTAVIDGREVALHGPLLPGLDARVVEGELRIRGPNVTAGYLEAPEATAALFDEQGFLRTGDLVAFVEGQLAVLGRSKDVIAVNGRKLHAHDVESVAESVPGVRTGGAVAISDTRGTTEGLAVAVQLVEDHVAAPVLWAVRRALVQALGVEATDILPIPAVPRTTSGKKRRAELRESLRSGALDAAVGNTLDAAMAAFTAALGRPVAAETPLAEAGVSSIQAVDALGRLGARLGVVLDHRLLLRATTLLELARRIEREAPETSAAAVPTREPIAIVGVACRLPGAEDALTFWDDVRAGLSRLGPGPSDRPIAGLPGGWLADVDRFEPERWRIPADEAAAMDPQQRLMLTLATDVLAPLERLPRTGVFVGAGQLAYAEVVREHLDETLPTGTLAGNLLSMLAARTAHHLDLRGPALTVDTACSAALVALHLACRSLQDGECARALAGAVNLNLTPTLHHLFKVAGALSPTGRCVPFAADADGTVPGEGAVVFVLEPLSAAKARGAGILGVVRSSAINNDGTSLSVMAPNPAGQEDVIRRAIAAASIDPGAVCFVEAHGTGTPVGDGVERAVLDRVYPAGPRIGATKAQVGHLMGAAGAVGLLRVLGELRPGELGAVSSFGFGGTNAHVIVQGGPARPEHAVIRDGARRHWLGAASAEGLLHAVDSDPAGGLSFRGLPPGPAPQRGSRALVTGATGALGRALCRVLADSGVDVVGVARKPARGMACRFVQGDITDPRTAAALRELGPYDLGFHLAGALDDPMHSKRDGLANLRDVGVRTWVLASSVSAVLPGLDRGLEAYAAANRSLIDSAARGRAAGRSDVAVSLAPIAGGGMARDVATALATRGIPTLSVAEAVATLLGALGGPAHVVAMRRVAGTSGAALPTDLAARVAALVARAADVDSVDPHATLGSLGIDSVQALDVLKDLERVVGQDLPTTLLYENDTVAKIISALGASSRVAAAPVGPSDRLLPSQQTFVVQDAYFPDMPGNVMITVDVAPVLRRELLEQALAAVVARHPALSSVIRELRQVEGVAHPQLRWVETIDRAAFADERFDLAAGPLIRVITDGHTLVLNAHHAIVDAWSLKVTLEDLLQSYEDLRLGRASSLAPLRSTHREVGRTLLQVAPTAVAAWKERFADGIPPLHLDWDAPVDAPSSGGCGAVRRVLSAEATGVLELRARAAGVSLPALVLAAWADRLYAWSGQSDVVIRVAHARREARLPDIDRVVGAFADGLPVRIGIHHGEPLEATARTAQRELAWAAAHAGASSLALASVAEHGPSGPVGLTPAGFTFPLLPAPEQVGELVLDEVHGAAGAGFTRLTLIAWLFRGRLHLSLGHARSHLSAAKVSKKADDLVHTLRSPPPSEPATLHGRVLQSCRAFPEKPAVGALSYRDLDHRSGALAKRLPGAGRIAVLATQGPEAAIALLAVLRSGGAFVPLDPEWPDARLVQILDSARPAALVTTEAHAERARAWRLPVVVVDEAKADDGPDAAAELAYVMYTSGSTGRPKGVVVHHTEHLVFQEWVARAFGVTAADRFVGTSSLGYGGALRQIFTPLLHGGQSCPVPREVARDPDALAAFIDAQQITVWNSVPSMWGHLMDAAERRGTRFPSLRWVLIGGEAVPAVQVRRWRATFCGRVANLYGSTETIVNATMHEVVRNPPIDAITAPIGWARGGTPVHLLDVQDGVGELAVGGAIARGYWEDPDVTAAAFVDDPQRGRLYRTGDLARRRADGALEFIGRADAQVQVHGNRVELPEIEHVITQAQGVRAASVVFEQGFLIAFVDGAAEPDQLRAFVGARLPAYMVPHRFEPVAAIPRNPAGKVDRAKLRSEAAAAVAAAPAPHTHTQALVATAWRDTLALDRDPGPDDDFFALGGDSIRALEVLDRLRVHAGDSLRPLDLYHTPRLSELAALLDRHAPKALRKAPQATAESGPFPLSAVQRGFLLADQRSPDRAPVWVARVPLKGPLDRAAFERALGVLVARHAMLRTAFAEGKQQVQQNVALAPQFDDLSPLPPSARERALEARFDEELHVRFDPARPPLFRVRLCRLAAEEHVVIVSSHHAASDAWSLWVLARDLIAAHDGITLAPVRATFRDALASEAQVDDPWWRTALAGLSQTQGPAYVEPTVRRVTLSEAGLEALRATARARALTPYALVLGCMFQALADLDGATDRVVSTALAGRDSAANDLADVVGPFARALPVRVVGEPTIATVAEAFRQAVAHSEASAASIAAGVDGGAVLERLGRYFLTWLDPTAVPASSGRLALDWAQARFRFATPSTATEVMVGVLVQDGLRIGIHGGPVVEGFAEALERRLCALVRTDAALIVYPPPGVVVPFDVPTLVERVDCALGRSELVLVPLRSLDGDLRGHVRQAAAVTNARVVALAGLLPSLTGLGREALTGDDQILTTGHAATVCAMARAVEAALRATGRRWATERVGVLGYGAIGQAVLALLLHRNGAPAGVHIEDPLHPERQSVIGCSLVVAATSVGGVLDVDALPPGVIVVDDSFPRAFDDVRALARMRDRRDVLLVGGGMLDAGTLVRRSPFPQAAALRAQYPSKWLPGCHAEAVLVAWEPALGATTGPVSLARALAIDAAIDRAGWRAAPLHLGPWLVPEALLVQVGSISAAR